MGNPFFKLEIFDFVNCFFDSQSIFSPTQIFKMDWLLMSIVLLCIMAMGLYAVINLLEKWCAKKF